MKKIGKNLQIFVEGKSHSEKIEFSLKGIKAGEQISLEYIENLLKRRSALGKDYATPRKEADKLTITKGIEKGLTTGDNIEGFFRNSDTKSSDYSRFLNHPRPGHVDYISRAKYGEDFDISGGAFFSGRLSVAIVAMGAIAKQALESRGINIGSHILTCEKLRDTNFTAVQITDQMLDSLNTNLPLINKDLEPKIRELVKQYIENKDSFGGQIQVAVIGDLHHIGGPYFDRLQAYLSQYLLAIPGSKGLEFGLGFESTFIPGSENNDLFIVKEKDLITKSNNCGGINGGIANGMPLIFNLAFKPTSSIGKEQESYNLENRRVEKLEVQGRHDPAFVLRVSPVVEAMTAIALLDLIYDQENKELRDKIDQVDKQIIDLYIARMALTDEVGRKKEAQDLPILDKKRESQMLNKIASNNPDYLNELHDLYAAILNSSKQRQENIFNKNRANYGLLGRKLGYSYSKEIHEAFGQYKYELIEIRPEELEDFIQRKNLKGLNVTIPYKKAVIPYLDDLTYEAKLMGVVNTIKFEQDKKIGFNTDFYGFKKLLINKRIFVKDKNVIVLGTGATSKTIEAVLKNMGANKITFVSRKGAINYEKIYDLQDYQVLINATPVGMNPNIDQLLVDLDKMPNISYVCDVVYNPLYSRLVFEAKKRGLAAAGGLDMLFYQAKKSFEIFTGKRINNQEARKLRDELIASKMNIVLVGMPGSGKTTIGRNLAKMLNKNHVDLDDEFFRKYGKRPGQIIEEFGEDRFREMETEVVKDFGCQKNLIISTGGGVVTREENYYYLKQNALIIRIDRDVKKLSTRNRPLSQGGIKTLYEMKNKREKKYDLFADVTVINNGYFKHAVTNILEILDKEISKM